MSSAARDNDTFTNKDDFVNRVTREARRHANNADLGGIVVTVTVVPHHGGGGKSLTYLPNRVTQPVALDQAQRVTRTDSRVNSYLNEAGFVPRPPLAENAE